jgi:hypothetical protein
VSKTINKKVRVPARDSYRIDHIDFRGEYAEWFYNEMFPTKAEAEAYIDYRNPKYRNKLKVVKFHVPEHDEYDLGAIKL